MEALKQSLDEDRLGEFNAQLQKLVSSDTHHVRHLILVLSTNLFDKLLFKVEPPRFNPT